MGLDLKDPPSVANRATMNSSDFNLHPQLVADCHLLGQFKECIVLLHRNAVVPWFILVPVTDAVDLLDLPTSQLGRVMEECSEIGKFVRDHFGSPKLNFGAIGNLVPQMHLHVIGRSPDDSCWPSPVWGNLSESRDYDVNAIAEITHALDSRFGLRG